MGIGSITYAVIGQLKASHYLLLLPVEAKILQLLFKVFNSKKSADLYTELNLEDEQSVGMSHQDNQSQRQ